MSKQNSNDLRGREYVSLVTIESEWSRTPYITKGDRVVSVSVKVNSMGLLRVKTPRKKTPVMIEIDYLKEARKKKD